MDQKKIWDYFQTSGVDSFAQNHGRQEFLVRQINDGMRILNIGVGNGALERIALTRKLDVWTLDPSEAAIERMRQLFNLGEKAQVGYSQSMPFADEHFDVVIMSDVLEHLDDHVLSMTLLEVHRVLRKGGRFIGTVPAREKLEDSLVVCPHCGTQFHRWGHLRSFDEVSLGETLKQQFDLERVEEHFFIEWDSVGWSKRLQGLIKKFLSWRGIGTYGVCRNLFFSALKRS